MSSPGLGDNRSTGTGTAAVRKARAGRAGVGAERGFLPAVLRGFVLSVGRFADFFFAMLVTSRQFMVGMGSCKLLAAALFGFRGAGQAEIADCLRALLGQLLAEKG